MSPTVFLLEIFYFFSPEESRLPVHVYCSDGEAKFWLEPEVAPARNYRLSDSQIGELTQVIRDRKGEIEAAWKKHSPIEVTNLDGHGLWLLLHEEEFFLPFSDFPWFREAKVASILKVELLHENHLYWPDLDVDLTLESIEDPSSYLLIWRD